MGPLRREGRRSRPHQSRRQAHLISLQVANEPATGQKNTFSVQHVDLGAGETRTLQTVFGQAFGNAGFALDPSKVSKITFYVSGDPSPETRTLYVRSVEPFLNVKIQPPADYGKPPGDGLVLWLDPSKAETITSDATGNVTKIEDPQRRPSRRHSLEHGCLAQRHPSRR